MFRPEAKLAPELQCDATKTRLHEERIFGTDIVTEITLTLECVFLDSEPHMGMFLVPIEYFGRTGV